MQYPQQPDSEALGAAWMETQSRLRPGWWIHLYNDYGDEAYWVARLAASQDAAVTDWPEAVAPTAETALQGLRDRLTVAELADAVGAGITPPVGAASAASFATAWELAASSLPSGWWISGLDGFDADAFKSCRLACIRRGWPRQRLRRHTGDRTNARASALITDGGTPLATLALSVVRGDDLTPCLSLDRIEAAPSRLPGARCHRLTPVQRERSLGACRRCSSAW